MPTPLDATYLRKLGWAEAHLKAIDKRLYEHFVANPVELVPEEAEDTPGKYVIYAESVVPVSVEIGLMVGDCVHNFRSALDHIAWQLARNPGNKTEFPIFRDPGDYPSKSADKIRSIPGGAAAELEKLQPFHAIRAGGKPEHDPLWVLHALDIADKHHSIQLVLTGYKHEMTIMQNRPVDAELQELVFAKPQVIENRTVLGYFRVRKTGMKPDLQMSSRFQFGIVLDPKGPGHGDLVSKALWEIRNAVHHRVLPPLLPFLASSG